MVILQVNTKNSEQHPALIFSAEMSRY